MKKIMKALLISFIIVLGLFLFFSQKSDKYSNIGLSSKFLSNFNMRLISSDSNSKTMMGQNADLIIKIKSISNTSIEASRGYFYEKEFIINSIYNDIESPYPGLISNEIRCAEEFKPKKVKNQPFDYYLIYSSSRLTYGSCSWDLINYTSILYYHYCSISNTLYQIELFVPLNKDTSEYEQHLKSLVCI